MIFGIQLKLFSIIFVVKDLDLNAQFNLYAINCLVLYSEVLTLNFNCESKKPSRESCSISLFLLPSGCNDPIYTLKCHRGNNM